MVQYLANKKAHRWGAKMWVLAESSTGYTHQMRFYLGKRNTPILNPYGQGYDVVMFLTRPHHNKYHHVTTDSWFTSPALCHDLYER
jgi:hypothetical protein